VCQGVQYTLVFDSPSVPGSQVYRLISSLKDWIVFYITTHYMTMCT